MHANDLEKKAVYGGSCTNSTTTVHSNTKDDYQLLAGDSKYTTKYIEWMKTEQDGRLLF